MMTASLFHVPGVIFGLGINALFFGLLLLTALSAYALWEEKLQAVHRRMLAEPLETVAIGAATKILGGAVAIGLLITVLGIPLGLLLMALLAIGGWVGLLAAVRVVGASLPVESLQGRPEAQVAAGTLVMTTLAFVPFFGHLVLFVLASWGLGAIVQAAVDRRQERSETARGPHRVPADPSETHLEDELFSLGA